MKCYYSFLLSLNMKLKQLFPFLFIFFASNSYASHILNGSMNASLVKVTNDSLTYTIDLKLTATCEQNSISLPNELNLCAYDITSGILIKSGILIFNNEKKESNCVGICIRQYEYSSTMKLPRKSMIVFKTDICCRRDIKNLRNDVQNMPYLGHTFYCKISGNSNASKPSIDFPSHFNINPNILDSISYSVSDNYADSIKITPIVPLSGATLANNYPNCSNNLSFNSIAPADFNSGYSANFPLGNTSTWVINRLHSNIKLQCSQIGEYVTAYKLSFYKNDSIYYEVNRELEVFVSNYVLNNTNQSTLTAKAFPSPTAELKWSICPLHVKNVILERSDSITTNFISIGKFDVAQNSYLDNNVNFSKIYYYRLKVIKTTDSFYSDTVKVTFFNKSIHDVVLNDFKIAPNPSHQFFDISWQMADVNSIEILSSSGQTIHQYVTQQEKSYRLDASEWTSGVYVIRFTDQKGKTYNKRILKID